MRKIEAGCHAIVKGMPKVYPVIVVRSAKIGNTTMWICSDGSEWLASELKRVTEDEAQAICDNLDLEGIF